MPIIVGGTNYYIESLLWKVLIDTKVRVLQCCSGVTGLLCNILSSRSHWGWQDVCCLFVKKNK